MRLRKNTIAPDEKFAAFLQKKYGFVHITPFYTDHSKRTGVNKFFTAQDKNGKKIFIKATTEARLARHEYMANQQLHAIAPTCFTEAIAYCDKAPYGFCATSFEVGITLGELMQSPAWNDSLRVQMLKNIYAIFLALKQGDIAHRDIHANQMMYSGGNLKLIDFQYAASKSNYKETKFHRFYNLVDQDIFRYKKYEWDDTFTILIVFEKVGCPEGFEEEYQRMKNEMEAYVGKGTVRYRFPGTCTILLQRFAFQIQALLAKKGSRKKNVYLKRVDRCKKLLQELKNNRT